MPTSDLSKIFDVMQLIIFTNPHSILDVGIGFGKYGFLSREYLEIWDGRQKYCDWLRRIDGIEVFEGYTNPVYPFIYNNVFIGNAIQILPALETNYDLVLLIDVLEHFDYEEGVFLLEEIQQRCRNVLLATPKNIGSQGSAFDNVFETHRFQWRRKHFMEFPNRFFVANHSSLICFFGKDALIVRAKRIRANIEKYVPFTHMFFEHIKKHILST